ncbi:MAG: hypothetical protein NZM04_02640 [Methylacidiphilales bacterium]|nr:hypothetical protein [Candidatus Methylacidiphilales bacterium]
MTKQHASKWGSLTAAIMLALMALPAATPEKVAKAAPVPPTGTWPFYRYDLQRTNRVPPSAGQANITQPAVKWTYPVGGAPSATVADITGLNGVPDGQPEIVTWGGGRVRAYNPRNGELIWISELIADLDMYAYQSGVVHISNVDLSANGSVEILVAVTSGSKWFLYTLAGANGQQLSVISQNTPESRPPRIADINGDGRIEVAEQGSRSQKVVYTFASGATMPTLIAVVTADLSMASVGDVNNDAIRELLYTGQGGNIQIVNSSTWAVVTAVVTSVSGVENYHGTISDVLFGPSYPGPEIILSRYSLSSPYAAFAISRIGAAPSYPITTLWVNTTTQTSQQVVGIADLNGGDREVVLSRQIAGQWQTVIHDPLNGTTIASVNNQYWCGAANLDADAFDELVLCEPTGSNLIVRVYDGIPPTLKWQRTVRRLVTFGGDWLREPLVAVLGNADFDSDGVRDIVAIESNNAAVVAYRGSDGEEIRRFNFPNDVPHDVRFIGGVGNPNTPELLLAGADGFLRYLDRTFQFQRAMYAGTATVQPYVVNTNNDARNEVIIVTPFGLQNLDPYNATQQTPPQRNWTYRLESLALLEDRNLNRWHPVDIDQDGLWEYPLFERTVPTGYVVRLLRKNPLSGAESVLASYPVPTGTLTPHLLGVGEFDSNPAQSELLMSEGWIGEFPVHGIRLSGSALLQIWNPYALGSPRTNTSAPVAVGGDINMDGRDDFLLQTDLIQLRSGGDGALLMSRSSWASRQQPMLAQLDADSPLEAISVGQSRLTVIDFTAAFNVTFSRTVPFVDDRARSVADVNTAEPGLEIVFNWLDGSLATASGVTGNDIYTRGLGMAFNTGTCETFINQPVAYLGGQVDAVETMCPGAARLWTINDIAVANVDNDAGDEILAASENGYLYVLNAENGSLVWAYNFYYPVRYIAVANIDNDLQLEVLASVADGFLYALEQQTFARPSLVWDGESAVINDDIDVQLERACYRGHWTVTQDALQGWPNGFRVALRDEGGALMTQGYVNVPRETTTVQGVVLCAGGSNPQLVSPLVPGRRYFLEVIAYQGGRASAPTFSDMVLVAATGDFGQSAKSVTPATAGPGNVVTWTVVVRNNGVAAAGAQMFDPIPLNTSYVTGSATATSGAVSYQAANNRITWDAGGMMPPGQAVTITFQTQVTTMFSSGLIRNRAEVINQSTGVRTLVEANASVGASNLSSAEKTVDRAEAQLGDVLTYTIRVTNTGTAAASGTLIDDPLPSPVTFQGNLTATGGSGSAIYSALQNRVRWTGTLNPGQSLEVSFRVRVNVANAVVDNCATMRDALNGTFRRCARTIVGSGGPALAGSYKTSDRLSYATSDQITYTIAVINDGTTTSTIQLRDPLPAGLSNVQAGATAGTVNVAGSMVQWDGSLLPGGQALITIRANLNLLDGVLKNTAVMTDVTSGRVYTLTREVLVGTAPSLNGEKFSEPLSARVGEEITYTIRLENTGNAVAASAVVTDPLPSGTSYVAGSAQSNRGVVTYNAAQQRLEWSGPVWITAPTFITWRVKVEAGAPAGSLILNEARSFDGVSDLDTFVATTAVDVPAGKALIRTFVYSGTGATAMVGVQVSAAGLVTVTRNTDTSGYAGLLVDAGMTPTNYAVFQVVPPGYVNLTPNPVGVPGVVEGGVYNVVFRNALGAPVGFGWVKGVVFNDANGDGQRNIFSEVGLGGWTVTASDGQTMQTLADGSYFFLLAAGGRVITQTNQTGWVATTPALVPVVVASQGVHEVNFGVWQCPPGSPVCVDPPEGYAWLFGYVYRDADATLNAPDGLIGPGDDPLALVDVWTTIGTFSASDATDASGFYYVQVPAGNGVVSYTLPSGYVALTPAAVPLSAPDTGRLRVDFGMINATQCAAGTGIVNGFVYSDTIPVGQFLLGVDGPTLTEAPVTFGVQTQRTNWMYAFACVPSGSGTVSAGNPAGYTNTTPNSVGVTVPSQGAASAHFGKAFQNIPVGPRYAYVPIVRREP